MAPASACGKLGRNKEAKAGDVGPGTAGLCKTGKFPLSSPSYPKHTKPAASEPNTTTTKRVQFKDDNATLREAIALAQEEMDAENRAEGKPKTPLSDTSLNTLDWDEDGGLIATTCEEVTVEVASDSGACAHTINPSELPANAVIRPQDNQRNFRGANNSVIENYGKCQTVLKSPLGTVSCDWNAADVSRALHSVSQTCGPPEGPGRQDVLYNNRLCVVVPPGIVDKILEQIKPVVEYKRNGNLYTTKMTLSAFRRQGQES